MAAAGEAAGPAARDAERAVRPLLDRYLLLVYTGLAVVYLMLPVVVIALFSFNDPAGQSNFVWQGFTLDAWLNIFAVPGLQGAVTISLVIALLSTIVATALGRSSRWRSPATSSVAAARRTSSSSCRWRRPRSCSGPRC